MDPGIWAALLMHDFQMCSLKPIEGFSPNCQSDECFSQMSSLEFFQCMANQETSLATDDPQTTGAGLTRTSLKLKCHGFLLQVSRLYKLAPVCTRLWFHEEQENIALHFKLHF